jgi:plastocyanin
MRLSRLKWALRIAVIVLSGGAWLAGPALGTSQSVVIQDFSYQPQSVTINIGESVTWINHDPVGHTATSDTGAFDTGVIAPSGNKTISFAIAGTYAYHCSIHPTLKGTVTVVGPTPTPGPSTPAPSPAPSSAGTPAASSTAASSTAAASGTRIVVPSNVTAASPSPSSATAGPDLGTGPGPILAVGGLTLAAALAGLAIYLYRRR